MNCFKILPVVCMAVVGCELTTPPSVEPLMPRRGITPRSYRLKLAVFNLLDPTGSGGKLSESISEMLHVSLFETGRFELMQRAEVRGVDPNDIELIKKKYQSTLDALVVGSITHFDPAEKTMTLNMNVMNAYGTTMAAKSFKVRYSGTIQVDANREDIDLVSKWMQEQFPKLESGLVLSRTGDRVTINLGSKNGVQVGMWVLIASRGDVIKDPRTGEFLGEDIYVGEGYVIAANPATCEALLIPLQEPTGIVFPDVKVKDKVVFK